MRTATCLAPRANFPTRRSANTPHATRPRRSCSRCATSSALTRTSSCRPPATPRTTVRWSMRSRTPRARPKASPSSAKRSATPNSRRWIAPECAACASTSFAVSSISPRARCSTASPRALHRSELPRLEAFFTSLPTSVVVDHMGTPDVRKGVDHPENQRFHRLMERHENFWVKVTCPERMTLAGPPYDDVVPFAKSLVAKFPDRVIWGTDWPHPNMKKEAPDDGALVDFIPRIAPSAAAQQELLVDNPMRLYWA